MAKPNEVKITGQFNSWSASRLDDYTQCPRMAAYKHLNKLCPACFKGKIMGGFDTPAICDTCGKEQVKGDALVRGGEIGTTLEKYVNGTGKKLHPEIRHPKVLALAKDLRAEFKKGTVEVERLYSFDRNWRFLGLKWSRDTWFMIKMDVFRWATAVAKVIDWKTGGINKSTGEVKANEKYDDQLLTYQTAAFSLKPGLTKVEACLAFTDCGPRFEPVIEREPLRSKDVAKAQTKLTKAVIPMMSDRVFAPRPSNRCGYCDFGKKRGGPCPH